MKKRPVEIPDFNDDTLKEKTAVKSINLEGNKDHLETKKQIESLHKQYGVDWLHSRGASMVNEVLGIKNDNIEKSYSSEQILQSLLEETGAVPMKNVDLHTSTPNKLTSSSDLNRSSEVGNKVFFFRLTLIFPNFWNIRNR